jgi:hypothetical protein
MYPTYAEAKYREGELIRLSQKHKVDRVPRSERRSIFADRILVLTRKLHVAPRKPALN